MSKRLITDRDVLEGRVSSPLQLDADTLITPAARDRCCRLGITVIEPGGGTGCSPRRGGCPNCGSAACGGGGACSRHGASHGTHDGAPNGAAPAAHAAATAGLGALPDGLYLVRVASGRVASILPATGSGPMVAARDVGPGRGGAPR